MERVYRSDNTDTPVPSEVIYDNRGLGGYKAGHYIFDPDAINPLAGNSSFGIGTAIFTSGSGSGFSFSYDEPVTASGTVGPDDFPDGRYGGLPLGNNIGIGGTGFPADFSAVVDATLEFYAPGVGGIGEKLPTFLSNSVSYTVSGPGYSFPILNVSADDIQSDGWAFYNYTPEYTFPLQRAVFPYYVQGLRYDFSLKSPQGGGVSFDATTGGFHSFYASLYPDFNVPQNKFTATVVNF